METDAVEKLKASGNKAFKNGKLDEALNFYQQAITEEEALSKDFSKLAILHSNSAQVYLKQNKFGEAILAASTSLEHDPEFRKSLLRRGVAYVELNKIEEATDDLRSLLRMEPKNQKAISFLRRVFSFTKLSSALRKAFIGHNLRRQIVKWNPMFIHFQCDPFLAKSLFRLTIISLKSLRVMKTFWKDGRIRSSVPGFYVFTFSPWFIVKRMKADILDRHLSGQISKLMVMFIIQVIRPTGLWLEFEEGIPALELASLYEFEKVYWKPNFLHNDINPARTPIKQFNRFSKVLTCLAYFDEIPSVPIPKLNVLVVLPNRTVRTKFVKDWAKFKWPIKRLEFRSEAPDLSSFSNFKGILSHDVTDLHMGLANPSDYETKTDLFPRLVERLTILKRCFPNLQNLIVGFEIVLSFNNGRSLSSSDFVKPYLKFLATVINAEEIYWCDKPKICAKIFSVGETRSDVLKNMKFVEETVKECRTEMKELTSIRYNGPSMNDFGMIGGMCSYSRIEMEANGVLVNFSFHTCER